MHPLTAEANLREGSSPHSAGVEREPSTLRHLSECKPERGEELGARHPPSSTGGTQTPHDRKEESEGSTGSVMLSVHRKRKTWQFASGPPCDRNYGRIPVRRDPKQEAVRIFVKIRIGDGAGNPASFENSDDA